MSDRKSWRQSSQESRQKRGYGRDHERMRAHLMATVILCEQCTKEGKTTTGTIADHIIPLAKGGTADRGNYQLLCKDCDRDKLVIDNGGKPRARKPQIGKDGWPIEGTK